MLKFLKFFLWAGAIVCLSLNGESWATPLSFGTDEWPPYEDLSNPQAPGFSTEVISRVFENINIPVEIHPYPWVRAQSMVYTGKLDGLYTAFKSAERLQFCHFPDEPLAQDQWVLFIKYRDIKRLSYKSLQDLTGKKIGVVRGAAISPEFWEFVKKHKNYEEATDDAQDFKKLDAGRLDYIVASELNGYSQIKSMNLDNKIIPLLDYPLKKDNLYLMFSKNTTSPVLVNKFSNGLRSFKKTEEYRSIYKKYFDSLPSNAH